MEISLKGVFDVVEHEYLKSDDETSTDEDDALHFIDASDGVVQVGLHHDSRHFEVEVEEGQQE